MKNFSDTNNYWLGQNNYSSDLIKEIRNNYYRLREREYLAAWDLESDEVIYHCNVTKLLDCDLTDINPDLFSRGIADEQIEDVKSISCLYMKSIFDKKREIDVVNSILRLTHYAYTKKGKFILTRKKKSIYQEQSGLNTLRTILIITGKVEETYNIGIKECVKVCLRNLEGVKGSSHLKLKRCFWDDKENRFIKNINENDDIETSKLYSLTELRCLLLYANGFNPTEISDNMMIDRDTVLKYLNKIKTQMRKMKLNRDLEDLLDLREWAREEGYHFHPELNNILMTQDLRISK